MQDPSRGSCSLSFEAIRFVEATLNIIVPVFGLIVCGYLVAKTPILSRGGVIGINNFVFYVAIPALLFRSVARGLAQTDLDPQIIVAYFGGGFLLFAFAMGAARVVFGRPLVEQAVFAMAAVFGNTVMLGLPLILMAFGGDGIIAITMIIAFHSSIFIALTTIIIEFGRSNEGGSSQILFATVRALGRNPVIISLTTGLIWGLLDLPIPNMINNFVNLLAGAAAPCALFALGAAMTDYKIAGNLRESLAIVALKLVAMPLLVWLSAEFVFGLSPLYVAVATIAAAMPVGANVYILAQKYETYVARSASSVLISTGLSVLTVSILVALFAGIQ